MQSLHAVINHLESHREASTLSLAYASVSDEGVSEVARFVRDNVFVKYLDLRGNNIQAKGAVALATGIKVNRSLRSLNLKWNSIGRDPTGIQALSEALSSNLTIGHVDLRNNRINNVGAKYVGEMLVANTTITHLDLSWNDIGVDGGIALLNGLKHNSTVIDCQLSGSKVGEETLHEVAFLLRRNRAAAAYKASPNDAGAKAAAAAPETSALAGGGPTTGTAPRGLAVGDTSSTAPPSAPVPTGPPARATRTAKDDSSLMLRLMMKEREQVLPEDKLFYQQITEHVDKLLLETQKHKQGRTDGEERERLATTGFVERERRYTKEIRNTEEGLQRSISDKENLQREIASKTAELKLLNEENAQAIRESVAIQEQATAEEQKLRKELRDIISEKRALQDKLALSQKDLELLEQENVRLRAHVKAFQRDVNEILA
eukprot:gnl/TRDRNA2_/TRDRNA2_183248_c0_seq1.p1 gnl/TRDRNA2_/TRDRNA2_183248_c0~~gnl/TRDRNA2_/TRDRNA2_183248_c0_seq1.p1  ORF type:complete len:432 (+),score=111.90 gnl/TRDRNA2_/TRDRNA2_183248_c0_seq1:75-1370(+)